MSNLNKTKQPYRISETFVNNIFVDEIPFQKTANDIFQYQYQNNQAYRGWCNALNVQLESIQLIQHIPFLPAAFFKTHKIISGDFLPEMIFESSGTTGSNTSRHYVKDSSVYKKSFLHAFEIFYGDITDWCIIALLPSYLERKNSSLVFMAAELIKQSHSAYSGFYLNEFHKLYEILKQLETAKQKALLLGVSFALIDFAEQYALPLNNTIIMETGGMKGRRRELTRKEVHEILKERFEQQNIHAEYGMTELLSQAYSNGNGRFFCPPWMKVLVRSEEDPLQVSISGKGVLNIIDFANIHSCSFIATDDAGIVYEDGSFEVFGRIDNSDLRGCSLLLP